MPEHQPTPDHSLTIKLAETKARINYLTQTEGFYGLPLDPLDQQTQETIKQVVTNYELYGAGYTDIAWVTALRYAGVSLENIALIWDAKDQAVRNTREGKAGEPT